MRGVLLSPAAPLGGIIYIALLVVTVLLIKLSYHSLRKFLSANSRGARGVLTAIRSSGPAPMAASMTPSIPYTGA